MLGDKGDEALVVRGCELGDVMSCNEVAYLASNKVETQERSREYHERADAAAKAECERGISVGCRFLVEFHDIDRHKAEAILARACRDGMVDDCNGQGIDRATGALAIEVARIACTTVGEECERLAELVRDDKAAARDALEHGCQHRQLRACVRLLRAYTDRSLTEPVEGRADSIAKYLCTKQNRHEEEEVTAVCADR